MKPDMLARNTAGLFAFKTLLAPTARNEGNNRHAVADFEAIHALRYADDFAGMAKAGRLVAWLRLRPTERVERIRASFDPGRRRDAGRRGGTTRR